jgi:glycosyltransferase involved in cell wall biosynthesis
MRIALIAPPFIAVPPKCYGGTELFIANLACELHARGHDVTVYGNGESRLPCGVKWRYPRAEWPLEDPKTAETKNRDHNRWAMADAAATCDIIHLNDPVGLPFSPRLARPVVVTIHHPPDPQCSSIYARYPEVDYVAIAAWLKEREPMPRLHVIHHGIPLSDYRCRTDKEDYVAWLGRFAPCKGAHLAIEVARKAGVKLKLAGEAQPVFRDYWEREVAPFIDGDQIEYVGEADLEKKNALLGGARALLFPIQWEEPFGLVMIEALACGTPVLAFAGGAVSEVVKDGVNGFVCRDVDDMARRVAALGPSAQACRADVERRFSVARMTDDYLALYRHLVQRAPVQRVA